MSSSRILRGHRVLDRTSSTAGTIATMILADYGADVVTVAMPDRRRCGWLDAHPVWNRGKRRVEVDLATARGRSTWAELTDSADVVVDDLPTSDADTLGFGDDLGQHHPSMIRCSVSAFGLEPPAASPPDHPLLVAARLGLLWEQGRHGHSADLSPRPQVPGWPATAYGTAYLAVVAVAASLYARDLDGRGQSVETSTLDGFLGMAAIRAASIERLPETATADSQPLRFLSGRYQCADGRWIHLHTVGFGSIDRTFRGLGLHDLVRVDGSQEYGAVFSKTEEARLGDIPAIIATRDLAEWVELFTTAGVPHAPILDTGDALLTLHASEAGMTIVVDDPAIGRTIQAACPVTFSVLDEDGRPPTDACPSAQADLSGSPRRTDPAVDSAVAGPPLEGIRIVDLGMWFAGPAASRVLADLGADVVKVEVVGGDGIRAFPQANLAANRGKRGIALDLKDERGRRIARQLVGSADVVTQNWRPGVAERLGMDYATARAIRPGIIYAWAPAFGAVGPWTTLPGMEPLVSIRAGLHRYHVPRPDAPPVPTVGGNADWGNAVMAAGAIILALRHRRLTGEGQMVSTPQMATALYTVSEVFCTEAGQRLGAFEMDAFRSYLENEPLTGVFEMRDGWIAVACQTTDDVAALATEFGLAAADAASDGSFLGGETTIRFRQIAAAELKKHTVEDSLRRLRAAGVACEFVRSETATDVLQDPAHLRSGRAVEYHDQRGGLVREISQLMQFSRSSPPSPQCAPEYGEHTRDILSELGYDAVEVEQLMIDGVVAAVHGRDDRQRP